jgi:hypothetical protein
MTLEQEEDAKVSSSSSEAVSVEGDLRNALEQG